MTVQIHYQAPSGWELKSIGSFVENYKGGASLTPDDFRESGFPVIPKKGVQEGGWLVIDEPTYCSESFAESNAQSKVASKHVVVTLRDLVPSGPSIGLAVRIQQGLEFILSQGTYGLEINEFINPDYFCALSNSQPYRKAMRRIMVGSTQVHIRTGEFLDQKFACPTILEQNKIAEILSTWDKSIKATERLLENSKKRKKALMQQLLTGKKRLPGFNGMWKQGTLENLALIDSGFAFKSTDFTEDSDSVAIVRMSDFKDGKIDLNDAARVKKEVIAGLDRFQLSGGDFVFGMSGSLSNYGWVPLNTKTCYLNQRVGRLTPKQGVDRYFLTYLFLSNQIQRSILDKAAGAAQLNISVTDLRKINISYPTSDEQTKIGFLLNLAFKEEEHIFEKLQKLKLEKKSLIQVLLTGKKRVHVDS
ncbi:restriction endonuclease subunit S [Microcoleus sp. MON1_C5]